MALGTRALRTVYLMYSTLRRLLDTILQLTKTCYIILCLLFVSTLHVARLPTLLSQFVHISSSRTEYICRYRLLQAALSALNNPLKT